MRVRDNEITRENNEPACTANAKTQMRPWSDRRFASTRSLACHVVGLLTTVAVGLQVPLQCQSIRPFLLL